MNVFEPQRNVPRLILGGDCTSSTPKFHVSIAPPENVLLTFTIDDIFKATIHQHRSSTLCFGILKSCRQCDDCENKRAIISE